MWKKRDFLQASSFPFNNRLSEVPVSLSSEMMC